ncbi:hypothetical protein ACHAWF_001919, partial [Thalassiosira exigua]
PQQLLWVIVVLLPQGGRQGLSGHRTPGADFEANRGDHGPTTERYRVLCLPPRLTSKAGYGDGNYGSQVAAKLARLEQQPLYGLFL